MPNQCPVDHTKINITEKPPSSSTPEVITVEYSTLTPVDDDSKCPVDPLTYKSATITTTVANPTSTSAQHSSSTVTTAPSDLSDYTKLTSVDDESKCPVDPSAYKHFLPKSEDQPQCPVTPSSYHHFVPKPEDKVVPETVHTAAQASTAKEGCDSDAIDSSNYMPHISQQPLPDQKGHLGKHREISSIPRANSDEKLWVYPSEQMFFNAMRRKNWNPEEADMPVVVPIHNAVNEQAWQKILEWEQLHVTECNQPKLLKFQGRPKDITPKARFRSWLGYSLPFDRHDWTVDRCGEKVTYVIDFYAGKQDPRKPQGVSFYLDVRPAVSPSGIWDRLRMAFKKGEFI